MHSGKLPRRKGLGKEREKNVFVDSRRLFKIHKKLSCFQIVHKRKANERRSVLPVINERVLLPFSLSFSPPPLFFGKTIPPTFTYNEIPIAVFKFSEKTLRSGTGKESSSTMPGTFSSAFRFCLFL